MRGAGLSCRTLFSNTQLGSSCGYNGAKWACMLYGLGRDRFHAFSWEQAQVVLQSDLIAEQNIALGYGNTTQAHWLNALQIITLAAKDNPDGAGVEPWWLSCPAYDHFLEGFEHTMNRVSDPRRGSLQIAVVNTDCAGSSGHHWFVVAWLIE